MGGEIEFYAKYADIYDLQWEPLPDVEFWVELAKRFPGPVLELACGTGRITIPIARAGIRVTGLDASREMLRVFKKKLEKEDSEVRRRVSLKLGDMRDFDFKERFGFISIPFNSFLHLTSVEDEEKCLRAVHRNLKQDGALVIDVFKPNFRKFPEGTLRVDLSRVDKATGLKITRLSSRTYDHHKQLIHAKYYLDVVSEQGKARRYTTGFTLRYIKDAKEMRELLERCGFRLERIYGNYSFGPFTPLSEKMIFVARKR